MGRKEREIELVDAGDDIGIILFCFVLPGLQTGGCCQLPAKVKPAATKTRGQPLSASSLEDAPALACRPCFGPFGCLLCL